MNPTLRPPFAFLAASMVLAPLVLFVAIPRGEAAPVAPPHPGDAALNHWVFDIDEGEEQEAVVHAKAVVAHHQEAHPEVHFEFFRTSPLEGEYRLHVLMESVNTTAQRAFLDAGARDDDCRAQLDFERGFELRSDTYLRLVESDPEKEKRMGPQGGAIVWSLRTRFPRAGQAVDCAAQVARHLNASYPGFYVRAYDEWFPRSGAIHFYIHAASIARWEADEARIRSDPVFRELMEGAAEAFVADSFEDVWLANVAR